MSISFFEKNRTYCFDFCDNLSPNPSPEERGLIVGERIKSSYFPSENNSAKNIRGYITTDPSTFRKLKPFSLENRRNLTEAERIIWNAIRNRKLGPKFRRQQIIDSYIVDFVCLELKLVIEIDGGYHDSKDQKEYDKSRTEILQSLGYNELRFKNEEVLNNLNSVIEKIKCFII